MRKLLALATLGLALAAFGCAGTQTKEKDAITKDTVIMCPKCGVEFPVKDAVKKTP